MRVLNVKNEDMDARDQVPLTEDIDSHEVVGSTEEKPKKRTKTKRLIADIMGGDVFSKDGFVNMFPFIFYIVFLLMFYITNIYIAEDMSREIARLNRKVEDLHVEYVYLKSEITKITKQSNMVDMLKNKGIKESVVPLKKIVVEKEGGGDED